MEWLRIIKKPEQIDLSNSSIVERMEAPILLRLRRYKDIKKNRDEVSKFVEKHGDKLIQSWQKLLSSSMPDILQRLLL